MLPKLPQGTLIDWGNPINNGLVARLRMAEWGGAKAYDSARKNDGTLTNGPSWGVGGLSFDGVDDFVNVADAGNKLAFANTIFSVSLWVKTAASTGIFVAKDGAAGGNGWFVGLVSGVLSCATKGLTGTTASSRTGTISINDSRWHHVAVIFTTNTGATLGNDVALYVDGKLDQGSLTNSGAYVAPTQPVTIGKRNGGTFYAGSLSWLDIYKRALSLAEILDLREYPDIGMVQPELFRFSGIDATSGIAGTLTVTLGAATLSAAGTVAISGTASVTLGAATLTTAGTAAISGSIATTLAPATLSSAGVVAISGSASVTLAPATLSAAGAVAIHGSASVTLGAATLSAVGAVAIHGSASVTLDAATLTSSGASGQTGSLNVTLAPATLSATALVSIHGAMMVTLADATLVSIGMLVPIGPIGPQNPVHTRLATRFRDSHRRTRFANSERVTRFR